MSNLLFCNGDKNYLATVCFVLISISQEDAQFPDLGVTIG